ncbi:hypothetical protein P280DRAFT_46463 [Massarina eburnea CBS 473.64]|uniref:Uncharacterized protein n=1 Tax=Massarina eburnea CBS 473.64 TaxID=1395130 RepID=A0A6A6RX57_9PLEO|nr:hypothetical protein P280DRAFT_46463 [Massarina eburnea CBS 473.64]
MANQLQSLVFEDGEWVTRSADVYQIMARSQQQEDTVMREPDTETGPEVPSLGILSRTVIETPFNKFVLPANIRHKNLNDVVFLGEDFVQLKEICDYGHLRHIATKSDFRGKILAARVFGDPRQVRISTFLQSPFHRTRSSTGEEKEATLPPEIIVLTLSSRTLMFLWASHNQRGPVTFYQKTVRLPPGSSRFDQLGAHLAVDPRGRAIAVAAYEGRFIIYKTKPLEAWRKEARAGDGGLPVVDEAVIQVEGRIMHMDFLSSGGEQDDSHVVLILVLVDKGKTKIARYEWDFRQVMDENTLRTDRAHILPEDRHPSLLIPLRKSPDFLLICDQHISLYKRVLSGPPESTLTYIPSYIPSSHRPGDSKSLPRWVQWDKAQRNPDFAKEAFYIAREDGAVIYVERGHSNGVEITEAGSWPSPIDTAFACLNNFDNSEHSQAYPDVLVSGGAGSDGLLCKVGAWPAEYSYRKAYSDCHKFSFVESIPSWAPLGDMTLTSLQGVRTPYERERAGIFVTDGKAPDGEVSELRCGLKAVVDDSFGGMDGCTGLWIVDHGVQTLEYNGHESKQHYATFVFTIPPETIAIRATRIQAEGSQSENEYYSPLDGGIWDKTQLTNEDDSVQDHIIRTEETIAACCWRDEFAIQITRKEAKVLRRPTLVGVSSYSFSSLLLGAATKANVPFIAASFRDADQAVVELVPIQPDGTIDTRGNDHLRHKLPCDTTCIELVTLGDTVFVIIGTIDASVYLFELHQDSSLTPVYETRLTDESDSRLRMVCESAVLLESEVKQEFQLVCGTRDGFIVSTHLVRSQGRYEMVAKQFVKMGSTAVQVSFCATDPSTAFIACGPDFCRMRSASTSHELNIDSIWLVDRRATAYTQGPLTALDQLPLATGPMHADRDLGGFMFAVSGEHMVFAQLDYDVRWSSHDIPPASLEQSKVVPRKIPTGATPMRMLYSQKSLHNMMVATMENKEVLKPPNGYRTLQSTIKALKVHDDQANEDLEIKQEEGQPSHMNRLVTWEFPLNPYERVHTMVEWTYESDKGRKHHLILVGTGITTEPGLETGRRLVFNTGKPGSGIKLLKAFSHRHPVRCMAIYDNTHVVAIIGKYLRMYEFRPDNGCWEKQEQVDLPSTGVHMTISGKFIHVSTSHDSHICYEVRRTNKPESPLSLNQVFTDSRQRSLAHHLICTLHRTDPIPHPSAQIFGSTPQTTTHTDTLVLVTDKTCSVTGLFHQSTPTIKAATTTLFEACLPRSVIRLHRADVRPPWRRPCPNPSTPFTGTPGILTDDLIGASTDGTIYTFSILTERARRVLRLLQNLIEAKRKRDPCLQYSTVKLRSSSIFALLSNGAEGNQDGLIKARDIDPEAMESGPAAPRFKHVDGDLLVGWLERGECVENLVTEECEEGVQRLARELIEVLRGEEGEGEGEGDGFEWVEKWLRVVLMPLL